MSPLPGRPFLPYEMGRPESTMQPMEGAELGEHWKQTASQFLLAAGPKGEF